MDSNFFFGAPLGVGGIGIAVAANEGLFNGQAGNLSEAEKEKMIMRCKDAKSDHEVEEILERIDYNDIRADSAEIRDQIR
ncbi:MAG: hypothetical protein FWC09_09625 [Lachnospiraceae bacterium]|nr:hypothetical protein [Lachnospiraceae bacterium]